MGLNARERVRSYSNMAMSWTRLGLGATFLVLIGVVACVFLVQEDGDHVALSQGGPLTLSMFDAAISRTDRIVNMRTRDLAATREKAVNAHRFAKALQLKVVQDSQRLAEQGRRLSMMRSLRKRIAARQAAVLRVQARLARDAQSLDLLQNTALPQAQDMV